MKDLNASDEFQIFSVFFQMVSNLFVLILSLFSENTNFSILQLSDQHSQNIYEPTSRTKRQKKQMDIEDASLDGDDESVETTKPQKRKKTQRKKYKKKKKKVEQEDEEDEEDEDQETYCICNDVSYGIMITCDGPRCKQKAKPNWFHLECVGLKTTPKGKW